MLAMNCKIAHQSALAPASTISYRPPSNQARIRPDARRRQLRVSLASPRYLVLRWRCGDLSHARLSRIRRLGPAMLGAFGDALMRAERPTSSASSLCTPPTPYQHKATLNQLRRHRFSATDIAGQLADARHALKRSCSQCRSGPLRMDGGLSLHFGATESDGKVVFAGFLGFTFGEDSASTSG